MKNLFERTGTANSSPGTSSSSISPKFKHIASNSSDHKSSTSASSLLSGIVVSAFSIFEPCVEEGLDSSSNSRETKGVGTKTKISNCCTSNGWAAAVKRIMASGSMRRIKEHMFGFTKSSAVTSTSDIWLLGVCYKLDDAIGGDPISSSGFAAFVEDFSSRILMTYRKGFDAIGDSKYTSDVNWGCMLRSSQMLAAQVLIVHQFGRSWRKSVNKQIDQEYIEILHEFGDSEESAFSIHKLLEAGKGYGLAAGSWIGPYATCRAWETLARAGKSLPMAVYIVSGDEDGERGGAPVVCVEDVSGCCREHSGGGADWTAILLLVPLVLGLDKLNPRYVPLLGATFTFPQSLGIFGGKPGVSTYIVGVQDENAFYLDPHEVQPVANITKDDLEADTSSFHSNVIRHIPLESIDPSLAIGFYCRDKDDFDDFSSRASKLADRSNGAPLFTVTNSRNPTKTASQCSVTSGVGEIREDDSYDMLHSNNDGGMQEDDWQLL